MAECGQRSCRRSGPSLSPYPSAAPITGLFPAWLRSGSLKGDGPSLVCGSPVCSPCFPSRGRPDPENQHSRGEEAPSGLSRRKVLVGAFSTNKCFFLPSQRKLEHSVSAGLGPWAPAGFLRNHGRCRHPGLPDSPHCQEDGEAQGAKGKGAKWELIKVKTFLCFKGCHQERGNNVRTGRLLRDQTRGGRPPNSRETHVKTTVRDRFTPTRVAVIRQTKNPTTAR